MNGKIKTKFAALFAVALMITVCVVPVVGGSEDVEAATTETVTISGNVYSAVGIDSPIVGAIVYVGNAYDKDMELQKTTDTNGAFSINVPKGNVVLNVLTNVKMINGTTNPAFGLNYPTITLNDVDGPETGIKFIPGTAKVSGVLKLKGPGADVKIGGITIQGAEGTVTTDDEGKFEFFGVVGKKYKLTATAVGTAFESTEIAVAAAGNSEIGVVAKDYLISGTSTAPFGSLSVKAAATGSTNSITSVSDLVFSAPVVTSTHQTTFYAKPTMSTASTTVNPTFVMTYSNGIMPDEVSPTSAVTSSSAAPVLTGNVSLTFDPTVYVVKATVGGMAVDIEAAKAYGGSVDDGTGGNVGTTIYTIDALIIDGVGYVGNVYNYAYLNNAVSGKGGLINATVLPTYAGYEFTPTTGSSSLMTFPAKNVVEIKINSTKAETQFNVTATNVVVDEDGYVTGALDTTSKISTLSFYVPKGTSVSVTAPTNFSPSSQTVSAAYADYTFETFVYDSVVTYTGQILLNGVPIKVDPKTSGISIFEYSTNNGKNFSPAIVNWMNVDKEPYYTVDLGRDVDASKVLLRIVLNNTYYAFAKGDVEGYSESAGITGTEFAEFEVKVQDFEWTVTDADDMVLSGMDVEFVMVKGDEYAKKNVVADLGKAVTDVFGKVKISAASPVSGDGYIICAIPSGECEYGEYDFASTSYDDSPVVSVDNTLKGYYTTNGSVLEGFGMSFVAYDANGDAIKYGDAKIIGNEYYIIVDETSTTTVNVKAIDGFKLDGQDRSGYASLNNLNASKVVVPLKTYSVSNMTGAEYVSFVKISEVKDDIKEGTVIVLSAEKTCYKLQNEMYGYKYSDAAVEYTFAGWYVNGKLLTEDCDASITLKENVVISAQYEEAIKVIASEEAPEAGLDTNVLILGIVVVVIALIAVIYSVISKRD